MHYERIQNVRRVNANAYKKIMKRKHSVIGAARELHRVESGQTHTHRHRGTNTHRHSHIGTHTHTHGVCPPCLNADYRLHADMPTGKIKHSVNTPSQPKGLAKGSKQR